MSQFYEVTDSTEVEDLSATRYGDRTVQGLGGDHIEAFEPDFSDIEQQRGPQVWPINVVTAYYESAETGDYKGCTGFSTYDEALAQVKRIRMQAVREFGRPANANIRRRGTGFAIIFRVSPA